MRVKLVDRRGFVTTTAAGISGLTTLGRAAQSAPDRIRVGQIGTTHGHANKLAIYRQSSDYEAVGIVEPDEAQRKRVEGQPAFRDLPWMTQEQLLNVPGLQAVLIETTPRDCLSAAQACVSAGKHIHLDKPAGESLPQFEQIVATARQQNLLIQMGYMYRYNPAVVLLRQMLQLQWLGEIFEVHAVMSKVVDPSSRRQLASYPGGMMFELGCHLIDLVVGILGEPGEISGYQRKSSVAGLVENALAVLEYPRTIATVKSSALEVEGSARRHLVVCGTEGTCHIQPLDNPAIRLALSRPRDDYRAGYQDIALPKYSRYIDDAADMARILRGEKATDFPYQHDLQVQRTVLRASLLPIA